MASDSDDEVLLCRSLRPMRLPPSLLCRFLSLAQARGESWRFRPELPSLSCSLFVSLGTLRRIAGPEGGEQGGEEGAEGGEEGGEEGGKEGAKGGRWWEEAATCASTPQRPTAGAFLPPLALQFPRFPRVYFPHCGFEDCMTRRPSLRATRQRNGDTIQATATAQASLCR
jgi:hypothetical protein